MAIRNILGERDTGLYKNSRIVTDFNKRLHLLLDDMRDTLADANGLGLAAPQVGVLRRVLLIVEMRNEDDELIEDVIEMVNPEIMETTGEQSGSEGCLSVPGLYGIVVRPESVLVRAYDRHGKQFEYRGDGLTARAICHEIDHLNGVVFTSLAKRFLTEEELENMRAQREEDEAEDRQ